MFVSPIFFVFACSSPTPDGYLEVTGAMDTVSDLSAVRDAGATLFAGIHFAADEALVVDLAALTRTKRCQVKFTLPKGGMLAGEQRWGYAPGSAYDCEKPADAAAALSAATRWARSTTMAHYGAGDLTAPRIETTRRTAESRQALVAEAHVWNVDFDLPACVAARADRYATDLAGLSGAQCSTFSTPVREGVEYRDSLTEAAARARKRVAETPVRQPVTLDPLVASTCQSVVATAAFEVPGDTKDSAAGTPVAYGLHVFAGETLTVFASSKAFDTVLFLYDATCGRILDANDDWRARTSRVVTRINEDADIVVVVRGTGGNQTGEFSLTAEVDGTAVLSPKQKVDIDAFATWAESASDADAAAAWRLSAPPNIASSCLNASLAANRGAALGLVSTDAVDDCAAYLESTVKAQKEAAASQSIAGSLIAGIKSAMK